MTKRKPNTASDTYARPTAQALSHAEYVEDEVKRRGRTEIEVRRLKNAEATVQARMFRRKEISERQFLAIDRFCEDWETGRLLSSKTSRYQMGVDGGGGEADWTDRQIAARERYIHARNAIGDKAAIVIESIFFDGVPTADMRMNDGFDYRTPGRQSTAIMTAIRIYADLLAGHYRIG